jgi:hypothetical protein
MIQKLTQANIGGAFKLRMVSSKLISSIPTPVNNEFAFPDLVLEAGADWEDWHFRPEVLNWDEDNIGEAGSNSYTSIVDGTIPKDRSEILNTIDAKLKDRWVVLIYFNNKVTGVNTVICLGSKEEPARLFRGKRSGGRAVIDFNGTQFFFQTTGRLTPSAFVTF